MPNGDLSTDHQTAVMSVISAMRILRMVDLPKVLDNIERASAIGPLIDPTLYLRNGDKMHEDKDLLKAALPLWRFAKKLAEGAKEEEDGG